MEATTASRFISISTPSQPEALQRALTKRFDWSCDWGPRTQLLVAKADLNFNARPLYNLTIEGDDGGVVIDATVNRRRSVHQLSFLSNLAERRRWDDASVATKWTLLEPGKDSRRGKKTDSPRRWWSFLRPGRTSPGELSANALLHWDSFGDATAELEIKKQAPDAVTAPGAGSGAFLRGGMLARVTAVSEAFVVNLRGANPTPPPIDRAVAAPRKNGDGTTVGGDAHIGDLPEMALDAVLSRLDPRGCAAFASTCVGARQRIDCRSPAEVQRRGGRWRRARAGDIGRGSE